MNIIKYKKKASGQYLVQLDNGTDLCLYEDVILRYELLLKKKIDPDQMEEILHTNMEYDVYYVGLKSLKSRYKTTKELKEFLSKKEYPEDLIEKALERLLAQGYLNDQSFAKAYINQQLITSNKGPMKLQQELLHKGVSSKIIEEELKVFLLEMQREKIQKVANRLIKTNRSRGGSVLRQKIMNDLLTLGYDAGLISAVLSPMEFTSTEDIAKKEYEKLYRRLSRKYSGKELEYKIKEKLYQKGLKYEDS